MAGAATIVLLFALCLSPLTLAFEAPQYKDALTKSILYFEGMRSGKLPPNQRVTWRGDSALRDGSDKNVDLTGGYYDSGDNVKFQFPMAFTITLLSWSTQEYAPQLERANEYHNAKVAIRWGADYLLKTWNPATKTLWVQVGDGNADHACWERPEDMDTPRTSSSIDPSKPGSDVAAETAAALAAASIVFQRSDPLYANRLLTAARQIFDFADQYRGSYSDVLASVVSPFYTSFSGYKDELLWGATWLLRATRERRYVDYIIQKGPELGGPSTTYKALSWDNKYAGVDVLLANVFLNTGIEELRPYKALADQFVCSAMPGQAQITPGGLFYVQTSNNLQYVTSNAFLLITYANYLNAHKQTVSCGGFQPAQLIAFARKQVDYILGKNPNQMSYMVGFGPKFPQKPHHRAASLPSMRATQGRKISCNDGFNWLHTDAPNPNVIVGAIVGGPDSSDNFSNKRDDYNQAEPSTYSNSGLIGALAFLSG